MSVVGFTVWLVGGAVIRSAPQVGTIESCEAFWGTSIPRDGILRIVQHYSGVGQSNGFRLRDYIDGSDWYFWAPTAERLVHNDDEEETNRARYGEGIALSRGQWGTELEMETSLLATHNERIAL